MARPCNKIKQTLDDILLIFYQPLDLGRVLVAGIMRNLYGFNATFNESMRDAPVQCVQVLYEPCFYSPLSLQARGKLLDRVLIQPLLLFVPCLRQVFQPIGS